MSSPASKIVIADAAVRKRVVEGTGESFLVQAPAGSGKTELLTQRYMALLATVEEPEAVLAITFTRKAASEMRIRILKALEAEWRKEAEGEREHEKTRRELARKVLAADEKFGWRLLENPARLQVRTVDSLADSIARWMPMRAGMAGELEVTEDASELYSMAAEQTLEVLGDESRAGDAAVTLLRYVDNNLTQLRRLLVAMLARRDQWLRLIGSAGMADEETLQRLRRQLEDALQKAVEEELGRARETLLGALGEDGAEFARLVAARTGTAGTSQLPKASVENLETWREVAEMLLTKDSTPKLRKKAEGLEEQADRQQCKKILENLGANDDVAAKICAAMTAIRKSPSPGFTEDEWRCVRGLLIVLPQAAAVLKVVFAEEGAVDFIEIAMAAKAALGTEESPSELALAMGAQVKHLLVDEFQDTSRTQLELVNALTRGWEEGCGSTLFLVGDPMQSIYAFREAEVTIFTRAWEGKRDLRWPVTPLKLETNFRSQGGLVDFFNRTYPQVLRRTDDALGAVGYSAAKAVREAKAEAVVFKGFQKDDRDGEARWICERVREELARDKAARIAILGRTRNHLGKIVGELEKAGVAFRMRKVDPLSERQVVFDLDALARAIVDRGDRTAWLSVLRAPWCGSTLADLWQLCRGDETSTVANLLATRMEKLSGDGAARATRVLAVLERATADASVLPLHLVVERAWVELGGIAALKDGAEELRDAEAYLQLLMKCEAESVLPGTRRFASRLEKLFAPPASATEIRVELMTMHGAKGLEWDVVFLPGLGKKSGNDEKQLLYWLERSEGKDLLLGPMRSVRVDEDAKDRTFESFVRRLKKERDEEESKRLLYVATTRAKEKLYMTAEIPKNDPPKGSLLRLLWDVDEVRNALLKSASEDDYSPAAEVKADEIKVRRLKRVFEPPTDAETLMAGAVVEVDESLHTFDWAGETRRRIGTVTHAFLEMIGQEGLEQWNEARVEGARSAIRLALVSEGVAPASLESAAKDVVKALKNTIADERGRWILGAVKEATSEHAISSSMEGATRRLKIDRTFVDGNVRWIVDFKTTEIEGGDAERFYDLQVEKYREDLARYVEAMKKVEEREIKCALYFPMQKEFRAVPL